MLLCCPSATEGPAEAQPKRAPGRRWASGRRARPGGRTRATVMERNGRTGRGHLDAAEVKAAATCRWREILTSVAGIPGDLLDGRNHPCPRCGGTDRFRLIDADAGAVFCNQCFRERNGDGWPSPGSCTSRYERIGC
ncbi:MAG: primase-helicase zinc-binding domain-containing protein [Planctomycetota bacterium]